MSMFEAGYAYAIKLMKLEDGYTKEYSETFRFKVE
jgi:hypothetical protein